MKTGDYLLLTDLNNREARELLKHNKIEAKAFNPTDGDRIHSPILLENIDEDYLPDIKEIFDKKKAMSRFFQITEIEILSETGSDMAELIDQLKARELG